MDWVLTRPLGWAAIALPILVLVFARLGARAPEILVGSLRHWRSANQPVPTTARRRAGASVTLALFVAGLVAAVLALLGPELDRTAETRTTIVVDRSPSMFLPVDPDSVDGTTRYELALRRWSESELRADVGLGAVVWTTLAEGRWLEHSGSEPPPAWSDEARVSSELPFESFDRADVVWITDRARPAQRAAVVASGGRAVPGPIAAVRVSSGARRLIWRQGGVEEEPFDPVEERVFVDAEVAEPIAEVVGLWAAMRGLTRVADAAEADVLRVLGPSGDTTELSGEPYVADANGWALQGPVGALPEVDRCGETRLVARAGEREALGLWATNGRLWVGFGRGTRVLGDSARFAADLLAVCDRAAQLPSGVVALDERRAAGEGGVVASPESRAGARGRERLEAGAAWVAVLLIVTAFVSDRLLRRRRSRARSVDRSAS